MSNRLIYLLKASATSAGRPFERSTVYATSAVHRQAHHEYRPSCRAPSASISPEMNLARLSIFLSLVEIWLARNRWRGLMITKEHVKDGTAAFGR